MYYMNMVFTKAGSSNNIAGFSRSTLKYHLLFWVLLYFVIFFANITQTSFFESLAIAFTAVFFYALVAYTDMLFLFPQYIKDKKIFRHLISLVLVSLLMTPIRTFFLFILANGNPEAQAMYVTNQIYVFFTLFIAGLYTTIYLIILDWLRQQRENRELENQTLQSELKFLKSQINPHFLFNTLNSLYALTLKKSDLAPEIVLKLSEMMRYMLYECNEKDVALDKEIKYMQNYIELEKLRHGDKLEIEFDITGKTEHNRIAPLLLIPFLENAFKHGVKNANNPGYVQLYIDVNDKNLSMKIQNSRSVSIPKITEKRSGGIGLINVKRRMDILYPENHKLEIVETPNTYVVNLDLNLNNNLIF